MKQRSRPYLQFLRVAFSQSIGFMTRLFARPNRERMKRTCFQVTRKEEAQGRLYSLEWTSQWTWVRKYLELVGVLLAQLIQVRHLYFRTQIIDLLYLPLSSDLYLSLFFFCLRLSFSLLEHKLSSSFTFLLFSPRLENVPIYICSFSLSEPLIPLYICHNLVFATWVELSIQMRIPFLLQKPTSILKWKQHIHNAELKLKTMKFFSRFLAGLGVFECVEIARCFVLCWFCLLSIRVI